jgi:small conductance mechanosensitive channel
MPKLLKRLLTLGFAFFLSLAVVLLIGHPSQAQFSLPDGFGQSSGDRPPADVRRFGSIEVTWINSPLDNKRLFQIASPTVSDRSPEAGSESIPVEERAEEIEAKLNRAFLNILDQDTLSIQVSVLNGATVIGVTDKDYTRPLIITTVTDIDADYYGKPIDELADEWRGIIIDEFDRKFEEFSGDALVNTLRNNLEILLALIVLTLISAVLKYLISKRQKVLKQQKRDLNIPPQAQEELVDPQNNASADAEDEQSDEALVQQRAQFLDGLKQTHNLDLRLAFWGSLQWIFFWGVVLAWCIGIFAILRRIPYAARWSGGVLAIPLQLLTIWFFTGLAVRLSHRVIERLSTNWQEQEVIEFLNLGDAQRRKLRISTIAGATKGLITILILLVAILSVLTTVGVPAGSVLAIGGLFGFALSFGSQNLVKDFVNGFLILAEDQYAIGDVIDVGSASGLVENLNLRVTQLRSADGELVTIPNSAITEVKNLTRSWSRVNFTIEVSYQTNPKKALSVLEEVAQGLYDDPAWQDKILAPPDVLGIDSVSHSGMTITTWIKTAPLQQWAVGREFRLRVREALEEHGINIGIPRQAYITEATQSDSPNGQHAGPSTPDAEAVTS